MKAQPSVIVVMLALVSTLPGIAQQLKPNEIATHISGATTIIAPSQDFDALNASDDDLAYNGFPPRPDQVASPKAYASWVKAISASKARIQPVLNQSNHFSGPAAAKRKGSPA